MFNRLFFQLFLCLFFLPVAGSACDIDVSSCVNQAGVSPKTSALIIQRLGDSSTWTSGGERVETRFSPASTSKIPHSLIALEEGLARDPETLFEWDGVHRFLEVWNQDQTLRSAYRFSALWVFQRITRTLGFETMSAWIHRFHYGNQDIGTPEDIDTYWVNGLLQITAREQIGFLRELVLESLPLRAETFLAGKSMMEEESHDGWKLFSKTGFTGSLGWYVGWLEADETYLFAFNMDIESWAQLPKRKEVVMEVFQDLGVISGP